MHRMRRFFVSAGLAALVLATTGTLATAGLLRPDAGQAYPDIIGASAVEGSQSYTYDASAQKGLFSVTNLPLHIWGGTDGTTGYDISPDTNGQRFATVTAALDSTGKLIANDPSNSYQIWGSVTAKGVNYTGLLLQGTPTAFGSQNLSSLDSSLKGKALYDMDLKVTGGALKDFFGKDAYLYVSAETGSTFMGDFTKNFSATKVTTNTRGYNSPKPFPIPEPTTFLVLVTAGTGLLFSKHRRRRVTAADLGA